MIFYKKKNDKAHSGSDISKTQESTKKTMDSKILQVCIILSKLQKQSLKNPYFMKFF